VKDNTPVNFGRRGRRAAGPKILALAAKNFYFKDSQNFFLLSLKFSDDFFSHRKLQQNKYTAITALAARPQIIGGGAPINKSRRRTALINRLAPNLSVYPIQSLFSHEKLFYSLPQGLCNIYSRIFYTYTVVPSFSLRSLIWFSLGHV